MLNFQFLCRHDNILRVHTSDGDRVRVAAGAEKPTWASPYGVSNKRFRCLLHTGNHADTSISK